MTKAELVELRECWRLRIAEFRSSGQTGAAWCAEKGIKEPQLWYWVHKFKNTDPPKNPSPNFVPVTIQEEHNTIGNTNSPLVIRIGQAAIEINHSSDMELLRTVVQTLASIC